MQNPDGSMRDDSKYPFIMRKHGHGQIFGPGMADGPFPEHYEPLLRPSGTGGTVHLDILAAEQVFQWGDGPAAPSEFLLLSRWIYPAEKASISKKGAASICPADISSTTRLRTLKIINCSHSGNRV